MKGTTIVGPIRSFLLFSALVAALSRYGPVIAGGQTGASFPHTRVAAAVNGRIVLFRADGAGRKTLTHGGLDSSPVMSPDGRMIAFLRTPAGQQQGGSTVRRQQVMLAVPNGQNGYRITVFSQHAALSPRRQVIAWEPGSHAPGLAWYDGNTVQYRRATGNQRTVLHVGPASPFARYDGSITFASDDSSIAAPAASPRAPTPAQTLHIAVLHFNSTRQQIITVRFRPGVLDNGHPYRGSVPVGDDLTYTDLRFPNRLHTLEFPTIDKGAGYQVTGLFVASDRGGIARLVLGNGHGVHGVPPFGPALADATHFQYAPNRRYIATDPNNGLWISGDVAHPLSIRIPLAKSCVLAQWTWLPDSSGLAYVTTCTAAGSSPLGYRLTLGAVSMTGGKRTVLDTVQSQDPQAIDLAPSYRCAACG